MPFTIIDYKDAFKYCSLNNGTSPDYYWIIYSTLCKFRSLKAHLCSFLVLFSVVYPVKSQTWVVGIEFWLQTIWPLWLSNLYELKHLNIMVAVKIRTSMTFNFLHAGYHGLLQNRGYRIITKSQVWWLLCKLPAFGEKVHRGKTHFFF